MTISAATTKSESKALDANSTEQPAPRKVRIVSLFSGAGGLEIAACRTGREEAIVSTDSNATFLSTLERNMPTHFPEVRHASVVADARELRGTTLHELLGATPDIVMGGPPCDDYTQFGKRRGIGGEKGPLIFEFLRIVNELKPTCFVFENVPNLARQFKDVFDRFLNSTLDIQYHSKWDVLKACDYGTPTKRTRVFVVGWRQKRLQEEFSFPEPTHGDRNLCLARTQSGSPISRQLLVSDLLKGLPDITEGVAAQFPNHTGRKHRPATIEHFKLIGMGKKVSKSFRYRAPWDGLVQSLTAGRDDSTKAYLHPLYHREMSVREYARLHLFPDSWIFSGTVNNGIKQVANSIPIPLGQAVMRSIIAAISSNLQHSCPIT